MLDREQDKSEPGLSWDRAETLRIPGAILAACAPSFHPCKANMSPDFPQRDAAFGPHNRWSCLCGS